MKKLALVLAVVVAAVSFWGCQDLKIAGSDIISSTIGIDRVITLYDYEGKIIGRWETRNSIDTTEGVCAFMCNGKKVLISGTYLIEEK